MRDLGVFVPSDCSAARSRRQHQQAIEHIKTISSVNVLRSSALRLESLRKQMRPDRFAKS